MCSTHGTSKDFTCFFPFSTLCQSNWSIKNKSRKLWMYQPLWLLRKHSSGLHGQLCTQFQTYAWIIGHTIASRDWKSISQSYLCVYLWIRLSRRKSFLNYCCQNKVLFMSDVRYRDVRNNEADGIQLTFTQEIMRRFVKLCWHSNYAQFVSSFILTDFL